MLTGLFFSGMLRPAGSRHTNTEREEALRPLPLSIKSHAAALAGGRLHMHARKYATLADILFKAHHAINLGKQGKIPAHAHVDAGVHSGAQLAHQNIAGKNTLAAETFNAAPLAYTVAAVTRRAACFLLSLNSLPGALNPEAQLGE